jgi:hypothetical protein
LTDAQKGKFAGDSTGLHSGSLTGFKLARLS